MPTSCCSTANPPASSSCQSSGFWTTAPYFGSNADGSNPSIGDVYEVFQSEFDVAYEEGGLYLLTMHPHMIGHRSRVAMLERLVQYMKRKPGVWFATHEQIANHVKPLIAQN